MAAASTDEKKTPRRAAAKAATKAATATKKAPAKRAAAAAKPAARKTTAKAASVKAKPRKPAGGASKTARKRGEHIDRVWEIAEKIGICMFVTWDGERQRSRPLAAHVEKKEGALYFLTDVSGEKDDQIESFPIVTIAFADHKRAKYVSITGSATVTNDRARIKDLWSPFAKAWWDSPEDPAIRVIKVVPQDAEFWDSPGRIVTTISMLAAAVTGTTPKIGENEKVVL